MTDVLWTRTARRDLAAIIDDIAEDSPADAAAVLDRLERRAEALQNHPARGRPVPELCAVDVRHYRELVERPWRIIYRIQAHSVLVLAVLDSRRDLQSVLLDRLVRH